MPPEFLFVKLSVRVGVTSHYIRKQLVHCFSVELMNYCRIACLLVASKLCYAVRDTQYRFKVEEYLAVLGYTIHNENTRKPPEVGNSQRSALPLMSNAHAC